MDKIVNHIHCELSDGKKAVVTDEELCTSDLSPQEFLLRKFAEMPVPPQK